MSTGDQAVPGGGERIRADSPAANPAATVDPLAGQRVELPPLPAPNRQPPPHPNRGRSLDLVGCLLLLVFAFLCASFKARNSDLFMHLASGRLIAEGRYPFGGDPFSFASIGPWINHSWLFDLLTYFLYGADPGGVVLVVVKALAVVAVAWVMLRAATAPGEKLWLPLVCTTLGVLTLSPRAWLQPAVASMLLLALTFLTLTRSAGRQRSAALWWLPIFCLLWVNLDAWFFLGPLTILAYLLGGLAQPSAPSTEASRPRAVGPGPLGLVLLASLAACLCNPYHVRAFTALPEGLLRTAEVQTLATDNVFRGYILSPLLESELYFREVIGLNVAGLAYFALLGVSLASFVAVGVARREALRTDLLLVWLVFALLAGLHVRAIPFFAVVAAPIASLNFLALLVGGPSAFTSPSAEPPGRPRGAAWAIPGRLLTLAVLIALCVGSLSGAIQAQPHYRRQVDWGVELDPGLAAATGQIAAWQAEGLIPAGQNWMTLTPETVNYLAWFAPGEKGYVNQRLSLYGGVGEEFVAVRRALAGEDRPGPGRSPAPPAWRKAFRAHGIRFLLYHAADLRRPSMTVIGLYANSREFVPCFVEGGAAIFAWRDPEEPSAAPVDPRLVVDFKQRAFGPNLETAPQSPTRPLGALPWWQPLVRADAPSPPETSLASQYAARFDALGPKYREENLRAWFLANEVSLVGLLTSRGGPVPAGALLHQRFSSTYYQLLNGTFKTAKPLDEAAYSRVSAFVRLLDTGPPDSLYLAVRACRRAIAHNPDDPYAYLTLAQSYQRLLLGTRELSRHSVQVPPVQREQVFFRHVQLIRQTQTAAALLNVIKLKPRPEVEQLAHFSLAEVFGEAPFAEPRVHHMREYLRLSKERGALVGVEPEAFEKELRALDARFKEFDRQLKNKRDQYEVNAANKPILQKAQIAFENGLPETAVKVLLEATKEDLRAQKDRREAAGAMLAVYLLLSLGRIDDVEQALTPDPTNERPFDRQAFGTHPLGMPAYEWFQVQKAAAAGDYAAADRYLEESIQLVRRSPLYNNILEQVSVVPRGQLKEPVDQSTFAALLLGDAMLRQYQREARLPWQLGQMLTYNAEEKKLGFRPRPFDTLPFALQGLIEPMVQEANFWTIRAWLALEAGSVGRARAYARRALALCDQSGYDLRVYMMYTCRPMAGLVLELAGGTAGRR